MAGFASQFGPMPAGLDAIAQAVRLNGTAVDANLRAFAIGRLAAVGPDRVLAVAGLGEDRPAVPQTLPELIASRSAPLAAYQDERYARRYEASVADLRSRLTGRVTDPDSFLTAAANQLARLMACKDEYEVARLYARPAFRADATLDAATAMADAAALVRGYGPVKDAGVAAYRARLAELCAEYARGGAGAERELVAAE